MWIFESNGTLLFALTWQLELSLIVTSTDASLPGLQMSQLCDRLPWDACHSRHVSLRICSKTYWAVDFLTTNQICNKADIA